MSPLTLARIRQHLVPCWDWSQAKYRANAFNGCRRHIVPHTQSAFMCRHTCAFVLDLFVATGISGWKLSGGTMRIREDAGLGNLKNEHWWLEREGVILDFTADQFGWEAILSTAVNDDRYTRIESQCKKSSISGLKTSASYWRGEPANFYDEGNLVLAEFAKSYTLLLDDCGATLDYAAHSASDMAP